MVSSGETIALETLFIPSDLVALGRKNYQARFCSTVQYDPAVLIVYFQMVELIDIPVIHFHDKSK